MQCRQFPSCKSYIYPLHGATATCQNSTKAGSYLISPWKVVEDWSQCDIQRTILKWASLNFPFLQYFLSILAPVPRQSCHKWNLFVVVMTNLSWLNESSRKVGQQWKWFKNGFKQMKWTYSDDRVVKCHGYDGYICVKIFSDWNKKFERTCNLAKSN